MENNTNLLNEMVNGIEIVGTLKQNNLKTGLTKKGFDYVGGDLVIMVKDGEKTHEHRVKVFAQMKDPSKPNKLYKAYMTIKDEYTPGMRVSVRGNIGMNIFENNNGEIICSNELKGKFISRVEDETIQDTCMATIAVYVKGFEPITGADGFPTGQHKVLGFTVGWGEEVIELQKAVISDELFAQFSPLYFAGTTGELNFKINHYQDVKEVEVETPQVAMGGFGVTQGVQTDFVGKNYVNNLEIIGGQLPYADQRALTPEQVAYADKKYNEAKAAKKSTPTPTPVAAFGTNTMGAPTTPQAPVQPVAPTQLVQPTQPTTPGAVVTPVPEAPVQQISNADDLPF